MATASLLQKVAAHEIALLQTRDDAEAQARKVVESAVERSAAIMQEASNALDAETAARRKAAAVNRAEDREAIETASRQKVSQVRKDAAGRLDGVRAALLGQIVPG